MTDRVRVGEVMRRDREEVVPNPSRHYVTIGVRSFGKGIFHYGSRPGDELGSLRFFRIQPNRLIISNIKGWEGAIAVTGRADSSCLASNRFLQYAPAEGRLDVDWAGWYFLSEPGLRLIQRASPGSADRNRTLSIERFEDLEIPLPPIEEQRRVSSHLNRVRGLVRDLGSRSTSAAAVAAFLSVSSTSRLDLKEGAKARAGWRRARLAEVLAPLPPDLSLHPSTSYAIAGIYSFGRGLIDRGRILGGETSYQVMRSLSDGDVVMSKLNGWEGAIAVVPPEFEGYCVSPEYPVFRVDRTGLDPSYFDGIARSPWFWEELNRGARGSMVRRRRINAMQLLDTEIWLPPIETQARIAGQLKTIRQVEELHAVARARRDALVPAALHEAFGHLS